MLEMNLPFRDAAHESFFEAVVAELGDVDDHTKMPVYLLSATQETRDHFYDIYDVERQKIRPGCWEEPWNTPMSKLVIVAALSLTGSFEAPIIAHSTILSPLLFAFEGAERQGGSGVGRYQLMSRGKKGRFRGYPPKRSLSWILKMPVYHPPIQGKNLPTEFTGLDIEELLPVNLHPTVESIDVGQQGCLCTLWNNSCPMLRLPVVG